MRQRLYAAAAELDAYRVARLVARHAADVGVMPLWDRVCVPLLAALPGRTGGQIAVEHALSEGVRIGLATTAARCAAPTGGVLLAGADREHHCLALHALAAALGQHGSGSLLLGPAMPWASLEEAVRRIRPHTLVVWAQTPLTGRIYPAVRTARRLPGTRLWVAGPGWPAAPTRPVARLASLHDAVDACLKG